MNDNAAPAATTTHTMIGHTTDPECCGCWNIDNDTLLATCNECGATRDIAKFLESSDA